MPAKTQCPVIITNHAYERWCEYIGPTPKGIVKRIVRDKARGPGRVARGLGEVVKVPIRGAMYAVCEFCPGHQGGGIKVVTFRYPDRYYEEGRVPYYSNEEGAVDGEVQGI